DPIRVIVGEDQPIVREGIVHVLDSSGFEVVATAADAADLVGKVRVHLPDVVVTDIQMPPDRTDDGLRAALRIRAEHPASACLCCRSFSRTGTCSIWLPTARRASGTCSRRRWATCARSPTRCAGSPTAVRRWTPTSS